MALAETLRRVKGFLDATKEQAEAEANRRVYTYGLADLDNIYYDDINGFPARFIGGFGVTAVGGELSLVQLFNPAGSGIDAVVEQVLISSTTTTQSMQVRVNAAALETVTTQRNRRDFRSSSGGACLLRQGTEAVASGLPIGQFRILADTPYVLPLDLCLGPSNGVHIEAVTVNTAIQVNFWWREFTPQRRDRG